VTPTQTNSYEKPILQVCSMTCTVAVNIRNRLSSCL